MYARMVPLLLQQAAFPADFTSWEECVALDEEVFSRFRQVMHVDGHHQIVGLAPRHGLQMYLPMHWTFCILH